MLQVIFGDDEHTAADGPYVRVMKTRKWLYISSGIALIIGQGFYRPTEATELFKVAELPSWWLATGLKFGLIYLLIQYTILTIQLGSVYKVVLQDRMAGKRAEQLSEALERLKKAEHEVDSYLNKHYEKNMDLIKPEIRRAKEDLHQANTDKNILSKDIEMEIERNDVGVRMPGIDLQSLSRKRRTASLKALEAEQKINDLMEKSYTPPDADEGYNQLIDAAIVARQDHEKLRAQDIFSRPIFRRLETVVDAIRILPPIGAAVWSLHILASFLSSL